MLLVVVVDEGGGGGEQLDQHALVPGDQAAAINLLHQEADICLPLLPEQMLNLSLLLLKRFCSLWFWAVEMSMLGMLVFRLSD